MKLREDLDEYKKVNSSEQRILRNDLYNKTTKEETQQLESRLMQQSDDMVTRLQEIFPDKEAVQKRLNKLDRKVSSQSFDSWQLFLFLSRCTYFQTSRLR